MKMMNCLLAAGVMACQAAWAQDNVTQPQSKPMSDKVEKSDAEWKQQLSPDQYRVLRQKGTERPFTHAFSDVHEQGTFKCVACGKELFSSETKFDSGTGWPSFYQPISSSAVDTKDDKSFFSTRTEVLCERCGGHLGHVFDDGPKPTGLRYCMNGVALKFEKKP
ncbi:MAG: peptide-methionine (R)-S-oxide reductase MsrB [Verrucomicrobiota bacterium]